MKVKKMLLCVVAVGTFVFPLQSIAAEAPAKVEPYNPYNYYGGMGMFMGQYFQGAMHEIIAEKLGMTNEELYQARVDGKSFADLLEDKNIDAEDIVKAVVAEREAALAELVKAKTITEAQKELLVKNMKTMIEIMLSTDSMGPRGNGAGYYRGGCPMLPDVQPGVGRGRMGAGPVWWQ